ncbi:MAG TPA: ABC transporter permease [Lacunisphaera sp.]
MHDQPQPPHPQPSRVARLGEQLRQDLAYAVRGLGRHPGFAGTALLTLSLGIGASAAMFSVMRAILFQPPPFVAPGRLVTVWSVPHRAGGGTVPTGHADVASWRDNCHAFAGLAAFDSTSVVIQDRDGIAQRVSAVHMSANLFEVLGTPPVLGRGFTTDELERREPLALISHDFWLQQHGGRTDVLAQSVVVDGRPCRIIGVAAPATQALDDNAVLWLPASLVPGWESGRALRGPGAWRVIARLAPGAGLDAARTELAGIATRLAREYPATNSDVGIHVATLDETRTAPTVRRALYVLVGAVAAVLLIACSNVASLLLARGAARQREFAVRTALGASRGRLVGQLFLENLVLALCATAAGAGIAAAALQGLRAFGSGRLPRLDTVVLDAPALAFAAGVALVSAAASGLLPALRSTGRDPMAMLRGGRGPADSGPARRLRAGLIVTEFALAIVLLAAAFLLVRSLGRLAAVDSGFRSERALLVGLNFPRDRGDEEVPPVVRRMIERVQVLPGVRAAGISEEVLLGDANVQALTAEASAGSPGVSRRLPLRIDAVSEDYFKAAGVPLRAGRQFGPGDGADAPAVAVINETLARQLWPGTDPVGRRLREGGPDDTGPWVTVVGIVADLRRQGPDRAPIAQVFRPLTQRTTRSMILVVATDLDPALLAANVRAALAGIDRAVPVSRTATLNEQLDARLAPRRLILALIGTFAACALALAGIGIFGLMNYSVACRTQEMGVRMALGARPADVLRLILGEGLRLAAAGIAVGLGLAALVLPVLANLLFEVGLADPAALGTAVGLLLAVALLACYLPARRAVAINPVEALRAE